MPIAFTIIFDIIPPWQRGKISGLFGAAFGLSSVFGPFIGAFFSDYVDWCWIFYVNLPLGLLSLVLICKFYHESLDHIMQKIDWLGITLLVSSVVSLMFALEMGGRNFKWDSFQIIGLLSMSAVLIAAFLVVETRVPEPVIPLELFNFRLFASTQGIGFLYGTVFIIAAMYIPIFVQGVFGGTATNSGLILIPMTIASVAGSQLGGLFSSRLSYRTIMLGSVLFFFAGIVLLGTLTIDTSRWLVTIYMAVTGIGSGISYSILSMASIHGIPMNRRGSANSTLTFFRTIGMTLGITIFGTIQNKIMQADFIKEIPGYGSIGKMIDARLLLQPQVRVLLPADILKKMTLVLAGSITSIFEYALIPLTIAFFFIIILGKSRLEISRRTDTNVKEVVIPDVDKTGDTGLINGGE